MKKFKRWSISTSVCLKSRGRESGRIPFRHAYSWRDVVLQETHIPHPQPARTPQSPSALINGN